MQSSHSQSRKVRSHHSQHNNHCMGSGALEAAAATWPVHATNCTTTSQVAVHATATTTHGSTAGSTTRTGWRPATSATSTAAIGSGLATWAATHPQVPQPASSCSPQGQSQPWQALRSSPRRSPQPSPHRGAISAGRAAEQQSLCSPPGQGHKKRRSSPLAACFPVCPGSPGCALAAWLSLRHGPRAWQEADKKSC